MANYYNPYSSAYPVYSPTYMQTPMTMQQMPQPQYMITVDGEVGAKSWQMQTMPQPNTIIPLFDSDGQHVYFKSFDAYGRMNPLRKGRIVFDDEVQVSETPAELPAYVTKDELNKMKEELEEILRYHIDKLENSLKQDDQNGTVSRGVKK